LNPQVLIKLYLIHLRWKQCKKNFYNSNSNRFGYLWICLLERGPLEQNRQEEGIDYEEVFAPVARIESIRLFLAYASFIGFLVYQMDVKSAFLYGTIEEEVYVTQPPGFKDPNHPDKVYNVVKALYRLHQASRACQDKYVAEILKKFNYIDVKSASTPVDLEKPLVKDGDADDVDVHLY
ncbi:putative ribonuclease H-like domain-containing protein, partial [Tanacetum coccineum]